MNNAVPLKKSNKVKCVGIYHRPNSATAPHFAVLSTDPPIPARSGADPRPKRPFSSISRLPARPIGRESGLRGSQRPLQRDSVPLPAPETGLSRPCGVASQAGAGRKPPDPDACPINPKQRRPLDGRTTWLAWSGDRGAGWRPSSNGRPALSGIARRDPRRPFPPEPPRLRIAHVAKSGRRRFAGGRYKRS